MAQDAYCISFVVETGVVTLFHEQLILIMLLSQFSEDNSLICLCLDYDLGVIMGL